MHLLKVLQQFYRGLTQFASLQQWPDTSLRVFTDCKNISKISTLSQRLGSVLWDKHLSNFLRMEKKPQFLSTELKCSRIQQETWTLGLAYPTLSFSFSKHHLYSAGSKASSPFTSTRSAFAQWLDRWNVLHSLPNTNESRGFVASLVGALTLFPFCLLWFSELRDLLSAFCVNLGLFVPGPLSAKWVLSLAFHKVWFWWHFPPSHY